ncbi:MAG: helix-hairpin-helix domain-containing protein, partial [Candidatus Staskawiczbacteria bacterium]|nr:helix-hairpin-helix domain-containing protein [Candidatus Staskawiczbacteria bacterium]
MDEGETKQDLLDDIQEKLDIIAVQVQELQKQKDPEIEEKDDEKLDEEQVKDETQTVCTGQINLNIATLADLEKIIYVGPATAQKIIEARPFNSLNDLLKVSGIGEVTLQKIIEQGCAFVESSQNSGGGGGSASAPTIYPKILISEVQISPIDQRFVELFNPNNSDVNLTGWYLQRKTSDSWNSFIASTKFEGKTIPANGYFLISRSDLSADIVFDLTLTPNNFLALKNPDGDISDQMSFGAVEDGKSTGRSNDTGDFELDTPTPKAKNIKWVEPPPTDPTPLSIIVYTISDSVISPDADGVADSTDIDWEFSEAVKVNVDIIDSGGAVVVKDFYKSDKVTNPRVKTWDGKDNSGVVVQNG